MRVSFTIGLLIVALIGAVKAGYTHFEGRQTHPVRLSLDGSQLFALNTPDGRLSVFDVSNPEAMPLLIAEVPVGLEPVSLAQNPAAPDEVWVVNELSDQVSIVSLSRRLAIAHLATGDEPADVAFSGGRAFVSCARDNAIRVYDAASRAPVTEIALQALFPRAMVIDSASNKLYIAAQLSGNGTTILPHHRAPAPPVPTNPNLPAAPQTGLIVDHHHRDISYEVLDHDVAEIDLTSLAVTRYFSGVGTNLFSLVLRPGAGQLLVANTEALNLIRFEPALRGHFVDNRLTGINLSDGAATSWDLNPGIDYNVLPNPVAQRTAIAQPKALILDVDGQHCWAAGFGSDIVAKVDANTGAVIARVDVGPVLSGQETSRSREKRGPRGLAMDAEGRRLFVLNRLSNTLSVIAIQGGELSGEVPLGSHDPTPDDVRAGRGFLFDARLSGNGTASCASCHLDADRDGLAWDLGDPGGIMTQVLGLNRVNHDPSGNDQPPVEELRDLHPMKGPKVTQTLRGMIVDPVTFADPQSPTGISTAEPLFHWRGDRKSLNEFNATFDDLMGGSELPAEDYAALVTYLRSLKHHPNPNRNLDRSTPAVIADGDPVKGRANFLNHGLSHCSVCHPLPGGSDQNIDEIDNSSVVDFLKTPPLLTSYQKQGTYSPGKATSLSGFGFGHDGTGIALPLPHFYFLSVMDVEQLIDTRAYVLAFDSISDGTAPAVGHALCVTAANAASAGIAETLDILESRADPALATVNQHWNDIVASGFVDGEHVSLKYDAESRRYGSWTRTELLALLEPMDALTFKGVPASTATLLLSGRDPTPPFFTIEAAAGNGVIELSWDRTGWYPESSTDGVNWTPLVLPMTHPVAGESRMQIPRASGSQLIRLRRTW